VRLTVCVTGAGAGVDSVWEQEKLEARKMLENAADSHTSGARFVGLTLFIDAYFHVVPSFIFAGKERHHVLRLPRI